MEALRLFETLVNVCHITRRYGPRNKLIYSSSRDDVNSDKEISWKSRVYYKRYMYS